MVNADWGVGPLAGQGFWARDSCCLVDAGPMSPSHSDPDGPCSCDPFPTLGGRSPHPLPFKQKCHRDGMQTAIRQHGLHASAACPLRCLSMEEVVSNSIRKLKFKNFSHSLI